MSINKYRMLVLILGIIPMLVSLLLGVFYKMTLCTTNIYYFNQHTGTLKFLVLQIDSIHLDTVPACVRYQRENKSMNRCRLSCRCSLVFSNLDMGKNVNKFIETSGKR